MYQENKSLWRFGFMLLTILFGMGLLAGTSAFAGAHPGVPLAGEAASAGQVEPKKDAIDETCTGAWSVSSSPNAESGPNMLNAVEALSANNAWAVGSYNNKTLIQHWDGIRWSIVPSPNVEGASDNGLNAVTAISANNIWAVGSYTANGSKSLIEHWDGTRWTIVSSPNIGVMVDVSASASNDVWAVGGWSTKWSTLHWNGTQWSAVPIPASPDLWEFETITAVASISANDAWLVGYATYMAEDYRYWALIWHWNGTEWSVTARHSGADQFLHDVTAISPNDIWAVGYGTNISSPHNSYPLSLHWNGQGWEDRTVPIEAGLLSRVTAVASNDVWAISQRRIAHWDGATWSVSPPPSLADWSYFMGITAVAANKVWIVGHVSYSATLALQWNGSQWSTVPNPGIHSGYNSLRKVTVLAPDNAWAVGQVTGFEDRSIIQHWDGTKWYVSESFVSHRDYLFDIAHVSQNDIWAVGHFDSANTDKALALHWNGTNWSSVDMPTGMQHSYLRGVAAVASNDVWAVGYGDDGAGIISPDTRHWDGTQWNYVAAPNPGGVKLFAVEAVSSNNVWAIGEYKSSSGIFQTFIIRWNGTQWNTVPSPNLGTSNNTLRDISVRAANDIWAVGYYGPVGAGHSLILHWNGSQWSAVTAPIVGEYSYLQGVDAVAANDVWAVGNYYVAGVPRALMLHWNGSQWTQALNPNTNYGASILFGVAGLSNQRAWAVGEYEFEEGKKTLVQRYAPVAYTDVALSNTFYPYVQCLACKGVDSGYACGGQGEPCGGGSNPYFRPNTPITRDNIARMVAASAGFSEPVGEQIFQDVPATNPYYEWVQRMANRGLIGGYPCGTIPSEPCAAPYNRPYFRPSANATRGQIAKIVSNGAGFNESHTTQTFQDVPTNHTFYIWVERLASRYIMGGYSCGGPYEPCGAQNKPYFRWGNNATRGQTAKITSNTFFPSCGPLAK